jgi:hypothetical protein
MCELLRRVSGELNHLSSPWLQQNRRQTVDCRQATSGNADLGNRMSVVSHCRGLFPKPPVGAVYGNEAESVSLLSCWYKVSVVECPVPN